MRLFGLDVRFDGRRKDGGPLTAGPKQPENFYQAVLKYKDRPDCVVKYGHKDKPGVVPKHVEAIPLVDTLEVARSIESFIASTWGGGHWQVQILDATNKVLCTYQLAIGGPAYNTKTGKKRAQGDREGSDGDGGGSRRRVDEMFMRVMEKNLNPLEQMAQLGTVMQSFSSGNASGLESLAAEIVTANLNNNLSREEGRLNEIKSIIEIGQMFTPKVAAEDPLSNIIAALPGVIGGLAAMKGGGNTLNVGAAPGRQMAALPAYGGNGEVDMNALRSLALSIPPAMLAGLPPDQQAAVTRLRQGAPGLGQQAAILPRPGDSIAGGQPSAGAGGGAAVSPGHAVPSSSSPYHTAIDTMIADIRGDLAAGLPDSQVAKKMISMMTYARGFAEESPHPMLAGMMGATDETGNAEFARLCNQIPELQGNDERIRSLGVEILTLMHAGATETLESLEETPTEAGQGKTSDQLEPQFIYETEADREAGLEAEGVSNGDVPGPTGIPDQQTPGELPGGVQGPADSETIRQTA